MNFSSISRLKLLLALTIAVFLAVLLQTGLSFVLRKSKPGIEARLSSELGREISLENVSFSFYRGLRVRGLRVFYRRGEEPAIFIDDAYISFRILPLFKGKLSPGRIRAGEMSVNVKKEEEGQNIQVIISDMRKKVSGRVEPAAAPVKAKTKVSIASAKIIYPLESKQKAVFFLKKILLEQNADRFRMSFNGQLDYPFSGYDLKQKFKFTAEGAVKGMEMGLNLILVEIGTDQLLGTGVVYDFLERNPYVDVILVPSGLALNNIDFLKEGFSAEGSAFISLKLTGNMDKPELIAEAILDDCRLKYAPEDAAHFMIENLSGDLKFIKGRLKLARGSFNANGLPLNAAFETFPSGTKQIDLNLSLTPEYLRPLNLESLDFNFQGQINPSLSGDVSARAVYAAKEGSINMRADCRNMLFNSKTRSFTASSVELNKESGDSPQKMSFSRLAGDLSTGKDLVEIKDITMDGYFGKIKGSLKLFIKGASSKLTFWLSGSGLDARRVFSDLNTFDNLLSGDIYADIYFDNTLKYFLSGDCYIKKGAADLNAFASVVKFPSLSNVIFDDIHLKFSLSRDILVISEANFLGPDVILDANWKSNSKIEGSFFIKVRSVLLKESPEFRRLLSFAGVREPFIDFKFALGGIPQAVRLRWEKGEFKERIESGLFPFVKRAMEAKLDGMIEELAR